MRARRALRLTGGAAVALFAALAFAPLPSLLRRVLVAPAPPPEPAQAIVVLGAATEDGVLSDQSLRRALGGIALFRRGFAPLLVMLGPGSPGQPTEAEVRRRLAVELGVPPAALLAEARALTTRDEARLSWEALAPRGVRRILLVTGSEHMPRAVDLFRRTGFEVVPAPVDELPAAPGSPEKRLELARGLLRELLARAYNRVTGYL